MLAKQIIRKDLLPNILKTSVWIQSHQLVAKTKSVSLGQGAPDWDAPDFYYDCIKKYTSKEYNHQYTPDLGIIQLRESISRNYSQFFHKKLDVNSEIFVTHGASSCLYHAITCLLDKGDEAIVTEPCYDQYLPCIAATGAKAIGIPLIPPKKRNISEYRNISLDARKVDIKDTWQIDFKRIRDSINEKTKLMIINSPHNPTGKVYTREEYQELVNIIRNSKNDRLIVIADEVYDRMYFDHNTYFPRIVDIEGMWDRTISIMSAGKVFSATGIRLGWTIGPSEIIKACSPSHIISTFCEYSPLQLTIADCLDISNQPYRGFNNYYEWLRDHYAKHRNYMVNKFSNCKNWNVPFWLPEGSYFLTCDISDVKVDSKYHYPDDEPGTTYTKDQNFVLNLAHEKKVVLIPMSRFYSEANKKAGENLVRVSFCKKIESIDQVLNNLNTL